MSWRLGSVLQRPFSTIYLSTYRDQDRNAGHSCRARWGKAAKQRSSDMPMGCRLRMPSTNLVDFDCH